MPDETLNEASTRYSFTNVVSITGISRETLVEYCEVGLLPVSPAQIDQTQFDDQLINLICRVEALRKTHGVNLAGIQMILDLVDEVESLRRELRFRVDGD